MARVLISGGPNCGKSKLLEALEARGHLIYRELAIQLIKEQKETGGAFFKMPPGGFQQHLFELQQQADRIIPDGRPVIVDSGYPEMLAYCELGGIKVEGLEEAFLRTKYDHILLLRPLPESCWHEPEGGVARSGDYSRCAQVYDAVRGIYSRYAMPAIDVPYFPTDATLPRGEAKRRSLEQRVQFVKRALPFL